MIDAPVLLLMLTLALGASLLSLRLGISVAIIEIALGMAFGNALGIDTSDHEWLIFLAGLGSVVLTFLAGAEIDPEAMKKNLKASLIIGTLSFLAPFVICWFFVYLVLGWSWEAAMLAGVALSTTSVAVVYVVLVETGMNRTPTGKIILSSCFITDLGTALALSTLFITPNIYFVVLIVAIAASTYIMPRFLTWLLPRLKGRPGEPELKLLMFSVVLLGVIAEIAGSHAVLPAYVLGLVVSSALASNREVLLKMRTLALSFLTPFFFINAGMNVSLEAVVTGAAIIAVLFVVKVGAKFLGVLPASRRYIGRDATYITLLMSTGLTFGTISSQYGLSAGIIDSEQFSVLVMTVILTAIIPTAIAQKWYSPEVKEE
ncbi:MAG: cation:proton antiporter [Candidatus Thermoplasmatota archaeon]|nr:cation:proton antiporter [Candidatus Thermoplasmatota archaeon]